MLFVAGALPVLSGPLDGQDRKVGLILNKEGAFEGYTLFTPIFSTTTFLIDMNGKVVHSWESDYPPGQSVYLLENGHLLRTAAIGPRGPVQGGRRGNRTFHGGGSGGRVQEFTWEGDLVWDFEYSSRDHLLHHDIERLPNGNILMIAWERKSAEEAMAAGRNPDTLGHEGLWPDHVIEVKPKGKEGGRIVWEWHVWDHLIQEHDSAKDNFGSVADHPELIDINPNDWKEIISPEEREKLAELGYLGSGGGRDSKRANPDWNHTNSIAYNARLDQIVLSVLGFNEIWVIDHSTTTKEAAGHRGGKSGRGGDLLYRWGNPKAYGAGTEADQRLFAQHDAHWIPRGLRGAGNILVFNNGRGRRGRYSSVDEIAPPVDEKGRYLHIAGTKFSPAEPVWTYTAPNKSDFKSSHISGVQRLPNGNTLICSGETGTFFEITSENEVVWKYVNPVEGKPPERPDGFRPGGGPPGRRGAPRRGGPGGPESKNPVFKISRYGPDYAGLVGKDLTPGKSVEELVATEKVKGGKD